MGYYSREPRFEFLVQGRAKKLAIRTINHFFLNVFLENARTMSPMSGLGATPAGEMFPWTDKFAMERSRFRHEENVGVDDLFWAGKTVRDVMTMYNRNPSRFRISGTFLPPRPKPGPKRRWSYDMP